MSSQNKEQTSQSDTLQDRNWSPQTHGMSSGHYVPYGIDDILQWLPAYQNSQLHCGPTYDLNHTPNPDWPQDDNLFIYPMIPDDILQMQTTTICGNMPAGPFNEMHPIVGEWNPATEPTIGAQDTEGQMSSDDQGLLKMLLKLEKRINLVEEQTRCIADIQAYITEFQKWTVEFKRIADTLAAEINDSKLKNP